MIERLLRQTVTIARRGSSTTNTHGSPVTATTSTVTTTGYLEQTVEGTAETEDSQNTAGAEYKLVLPAGTGIDHSDRVTIDSVTYEVTGIPASAVRATTGAEHHIEARVRRVDG